MKDQHLCLDIISTLPPSIIETILCLVPIQEAVRTCILSKEWRYCWTKIPKLVFNEFTFEVSTNENRLSTLNYNQTVELRQRKRRKLLYAINQVMLLRQGPILEFTLDMVADDPDTCLQIDQIITHLSRNNTLKKLSLDLTHGYRLLLSIFSLHPLTDLYLRRCDVYHQPPFNGFGSLTSLYLNDVNIYTKDKYFLSSFPLLKTLTLYLGEHNIFSNEVPPIIELYECIPLIEDLTTWRWLPPRLAPGAVPRQLPTSLFNLKTLCLDTTFYIEEYGLSLLIMLIRSSPNLEKIKLQVIPEGLDHLWLYDLDFVTKQKYSDVWLEHLKELEIEDFSNLKPDSDFVKLILAKSPVLKKVSIIIKDDVTKDEEMLILTTLLHSPHASPLVEIIVEHPEQCCKNWSFDSFRPSIQRVLVAEESSEES